MLMILFLITTGVMILSQFTHELRWILMEKLENPEKLSYNEIISQGQSNLFDFEYPIFDENYRTTLQTNICKHYYTSEICCDAVQRFKLWLDVRLNTIMPYYNKLYESELLKINPLTDYSEDETYTRTAKQTGDSNLTQNDTTNVETETNVNDETSANSSSLSKNSNTPQAMLSNLEYYDGATDTTENGTSSNTSKTEGTNKGTYGSQRNNTYSQDNSENSDRHREGYHTSQSDLLNKYRSTFLKIDMMIIDDLSDLFFGILSVG